MRNQPLSQNYTNENISHNKMDAVKYLNGPTPQKRCFSCGSTSHFKYNCPRLRVEEQDSRPVQNKLNKPSEITNITSINVPSVTNEYSSEKIEIFGELNNTETNLIIHTGASITVIDKKNINI